MATSADPTPQIAARLGAEHAVLFGRARSALLALFEALGLHGRSTIVIPSNACPSLFACAWASGVQVRLAPVSAETGINTDLALAEYLQSLSEQGHSGAVLLTHLYGFRIDFPHTRKIAKALGWVAIENDANSARAARSEPVEDIARIVSFGAGKVLDAGLGGAVLTQDNALANTLNQIADRYPVLDAQADLDETALNLKRRALRNAGRSEACETLLLEEVRQLRFSFPSQANPDLLTTLARGSENLAQREDTLGLWKEALSDFTPHLNLITLPQPAPWRMIARCSPTFRDKAVTALRRAGLDAGTNYPPLSDAFPSLAGTDAHDDADLWGRSVLNLWVDTHYDKGRIETARTLLTSFLEPLS